ncbi:hypothetical protein PM082_004330 [Marasmius tenuissimus]|nr:hypothetical protein PM082_004330 [Marasmius tenuissimus]
MHPEVVIEVPTLILNRPVTKNSSARFRSLPTSKLSTSSTPPEQAVMYASDSELHHYTFQWSFRCNRLLNEKKLLSAQTQVLTHIRADRIKATSEIVYSKRNSLLCDAFILQKSSNRIPYSDFLLTPAATPLNDLIYHTPVNEPVTVRDLKGVFGIIDLEGVARTWATNVVEPQLDDSILRVSPPSVPFSDATIFKCKFCALALWGSSVYLYQCLTPDSTPMSTLTPPAWKSAKYHN